MWRGEGVSGGGGGGVSSSQLAGMLIGYATETWVDEHYISIDFFSRLFQAHGTENGSEIDVMPNDLETTITSVESMFGFWTNLYISALGSNGAAPAGISLGMLTDVVISGTPSAGQVLTFDAVTQKWVNSNAQAGATALANLTDVTLTSLQNGQILIYDANTQKWVNSSVKTINGYSIFGTGDIPASGGGGGNYLPLAGGTMTGDITFSGNRYLRNANGYGAVMITNSWTTLGADNISAGIDTYIDGRNIHIRSGSQSDTILCNSNKNVNVYGCLSVTGVSGIWTQGIVINPATDGVSFLAAKDNYGNIFAFVHKGNHVCEFDINSATSSYVINVPLANGTMALDGYCTGQRFYMDNGTNILYCNNSARLSILACGEAAATIQIRPLAMSNENNMTTFLSNGNVGISVASPSYKLHVAGTIYATGAITALSDMRDKTVVENIRDIDIEKIAKAPIFTYHWKDKIERRCDLHIGSSAQYWKTVLPEAVLMANDGRGTLSMQYGVAALVSAIVTARKVVDHERRIQALEDKERRLG